MRRAILTVLLAASLCQIGVAQDLPDLQEQVADYRALVEAQKRALAAKDREIAALEKQVEDYQAVAGVSKPSKWDRLKLGLTLAGAVASVLTVTLK